MSDVGHYHGRSTKHSSYYYPHEGNSTLNTSITIHVTPEHYHLKSWAVLWGCFVVSIVFAAVQVHYENAWFDEVSAKDQEDGTVSATSKKNRKKSSSNNGTSTEFATRDGRPIRMIGTGGTRRSRYDVENGDSLSSSDAEVSISTADWTRRKFRILLLMAMICRTVMIPIQIYLEPIWIQLVADTLPAMSFASAWTLLVSFFVKLVGVALGATGSGDSDSHHNTKQNGSNDGRGAAGNVALPVRTVIQLTAYVLYFLLMGTFFMNPVAAVLLYAFLACIYAALLGTSLYFCPRLLTLLYPTLSSMMNTSTNSTGDNLGQASSSSSNLRSVGSTTGNEDVKGGNDGTNRSRSKYSALAVRLSFCGVLCVIVFGARTVGFCRQIVTPDQAESWWWQYGCLELIPAVIFLILIKPKSSNRNTTSGTNIGGNSTSKGGSKSPPPPSYGSSSQRQTQQQQQQQRHNPQQLFRSNSYGSGNGGFGGRRSENTPLLKSAGGYGSGVGGISSGPPSPSAPH